MKGAEKMDATLEKRLTRLQNCPTKYEIIVECVDDGLKYLLVYSARWTRAVSRSEIQRFINDIETVTGVSPKEWKCGNRVGDPITGTSIDGREWRIRKSGRTQRDAYCNGELPWIVDVEAELV